MRTLRIPTLMTMCNVCNAVLLPHAHTFQGHISTARMCKRLSASPCGRREGLWGFAALRAAPRPRFSQPYTPVRTPGVWLDLP